MRSSIALRRSSRGKNSAKIFAQCAGHIASAKNIGTECSDRSAIPMDKGFAHRGVISQLLVFNFLAPSFAREMKNFPPAQEKIR